MFDLRRQAPLFGLALLLAPILACASPPQSRTDSAAAVDSAQRTPKILNLVSDEGYITDFPGVTGRRPGGIEYIVHNYLVVRNDRDEFVPQLAAEQISVEKGTWRLNSDGTMDTTWRILPNVKWHDGTPFTSEDLLFSFNAFKDPELPSRFGSALRDMESATIPDPLTLVVHWRRPFATANEAPALIPMPKHQLEDAYLNDKANFGNNPKLLYQFVGLGAYRLVNWTVGTQVEFERFDNYYRGRPPLDRVIIRFISDPRTVMANLLAGTIDMAAGNRVDLEAAVELKQRWEGTGANVKFSPLGDLQQIEIQFRPEFARPRNGLIERPVRQALFHALDRKSLVEAVAHGLTPVADHWFSPIHALFAEVDSATPKYPYDPTRAQQLLAQAGWVRGGDGILVHNQTGDRFELEVYIQEEKSEDDQAIVADNWKAIGVQPIQKALPQPRDREFEAKQPGALVTSPKGYEVPYVESSRLYTSNISSAANKWTGRNRGGYTNAQVDALIERLALTIDVRETVPLHRQLIQEALTDVALIPIYFDVDSIATQKGVKGPLGGTWVEWNFFDWDKDS
jgi:peptide/nickel transport system substrate-binding protein